MVVIEKYLSVEFAFFPHNLTYCQLMYIFRAYREIVIRDTGECVDLTGPPLHQTEEVVHSELQDKVDLVDLTESLDKGLVPSCFLALSILESRESLQNY